MLFLDEIVVFELIKSATNSGLPAKRRNSSTNSLSLNGGSVNATSATPLLGGFPGAGTIGSSAAATVGVSSLPDMNDPAVINQFLASLSQHHHHQQQQQSQHPTTLPVSAASLTQKSNVETSNKLQTPSPLTPAAMDLTAAMNEQIQKQQIAELMFLKQMRFMLGNQSDTTVLPSPLGQDSVKNDKPSSPLLSTSSPASLSLPALQLPSQQTPPILPPLASSPIDSQTPTNTPLDHLLQLYGINRESYLKLLQHQEQLKHQTDCTAQTLESSINSRNMDLHSSPKGELLAHSIYNLHFSLTLLSLSPISFLSFLVC